MTLKKICLVFVCSYLLCSYKKIAFSNDILLDGIPAGSRLISSYIDAIILIVTVYSVMNVLYVCTCKVSTVYIYICYNIIFIYR